HPSTTFTLFPYTTLFRSGRCPKRTVWLVPEVDVVDPEVVGLRLVDALDLDGDHVGRGPREDLPPSLLLELRAVREVDDDAVPGVDRKSTRLNSSHQIISY